MATAHSRFSVVGELLSSAFCKTAATVSRRRGYPKLPALSDNPLPSSTYYLHTVPGRSKQLNLRNFLSSTTGHNATTQTNSMLKRSCIVSTERNTNCVNVRKERCWRLEWTILLQLVDTSQARECKRESVTLLVGKYVEVRLVDFLIGN
jgi:hypothetical protein